MPGMAGATAGFAGGIGGGAAMATSAPTLIGGVSAATSSGFNPLMMLMGVQSLGTAMTSYSQAKALESEGKFNAAIYESNARMQELRAEDSIRRGNVEAKKAKQAAARLIGSQRATMGAQGIDIESGSALDIQMETASFGAEDALTIKNNAWREAWGLRASAVDYYGKGRFEKLTAESKAKNTILTGGLTIAKNLAYGAYRSNNPTTLSDYLTDGGYA